MSKQLKIGLIGFGCVGSGLYEVLNKSNLFDAEITRIVVKNPNKERTIGRENFSYDVNVILNDPEINVVVELINDTEAAYHIVKEALSRGKNVVSANKKLIAENLEELVGLAKRNQTSFLYEAAVGGSIPIIRNLEEYYNNDTLNSIEGIVNGTTNYILSRSNQGVDYQSALTEAQNLGFAEIDPSLDVEGFDSKYKLVLLLKHAFGLSVVPEEVINIGISSLSNSAIEYAQEKGYRIKLISRAEKISNRIVAFVAPHFVGPDHFAYNINNEFNAVIVEALFSDKQLFIGKGAGSYPTASAVLSDISALKYDYQYEYKKESDQLNLIHDNDIYVNVFVSSNSISFIEKYELKEQNEIYVSRDSVFRTGWIKLRDLDQIGRDLNTSVIILPGSFKSESEFKSKGEKTLLIENTGT